MIRWTGRLGLVLGVLCLGGGIQGFVMEESLASLIAGLLAGFFLVLGGYCSLTGQARGRIPILVISVLLLGRFLPLFLKNPGNLWPALAISAVAALAALLALLTLVGKPTPGTGAGPEAG